MVYCRGSQFILRPLNPTTSIIVENTKHCPFVQRSYYKKSKSTQKASQTLKLTDLTINIQYVQIDTYSIPLAGRGVLLPLAGGTNRRGVLNV